ncbi:MAG: heparinase II/III domain-containing protein, partial [Anaerolineae bacterium]
KLYFQYVRRYIDFALQTLALAWLLGEQEKYAEAAKELFFNVGEWANEGVASVNWAHGDEPGLSTCRCMHRVYDWLYHAMSAEERQRGAEICLKAARDNWERIYRRRNFHLAPGESHNGRLIAYLGEEAVALCDIVPDEAQRWLDFSLKAFMTIYPHWGGADGGWAEGISYGNAYNLIYLPWMEVIRVVSDVDLWQRPFFGKVRNFFMYCTTPYAEMRPFGDGADPGRNVANRHQQLHTLLRHHGQRFEDPLAVWLADQLDPDWSSASFNPVTTMITADKIQPKPPDDGRAMKVFRGIGWAALHSDFGNFDNDVFVLFKSSPYGSISHQHADQNAFYLAVGGKALAIPSGYYAPYYGSPHHAEWTRATKAQNAILVNGEGQIIRDHRAKGQIADFDHQGQLSYVCGDATEAYMGRLEAWQRHLFFIRPGLVVIVDDVRAPEASTFQWLLHALEEMAVDEAAQTVVIEHENAKMEVRLFSTLDEPLRFSQTDEFEPPVEAGQPPEYDDQMPDQYHFTAETAAEAAQIRFVAVIAAGKAEAMLTVNVETKAGEVIATIEDEAGTGTVTVPLMTKPEMAGTAVWQGADGERGQVGTPVV